MKRGQRIAVWAVGGILVLAGVGWGAVSLSRHLVYGTVVTEAELAFSVEVGERFSLSVPDSGPSVGDIWSAQAAPAELLDYAGKRKVTGDVSERFLGSPPGGGSGTSYFTYTAKRSGTATVVVTNCFRGYADARTQAMSRAVTWIVTVK